MRSYYVYILTNNSGTLYTGITANIAQRLAQHRKASPATFAGRYATGRLVLVEQTSDVYAALEREKEIKGWTRAKKIALISEMNPKWEDLGVHVLGERWVSPGSTAQVRRTDVASDRGGSG
jgi:putative endonuclease